MKKLKLMCIITLLLILINTFTISVFSDELTVLQPYETQLNNTLTLANIDYTESTETINNPCAGYTSTVWYTCKPNETPIKNPTGNLVLMFIDIGAFSSGINGTTDENGDYIEGTDYDLDATFFNSLRATFENCRNNGCTIAVRFRYDANGKDNPEPSSFEQVLNHIQQIKNDGILEDYRDILCFVESGFVGKWGEQHGGKYVSLEYKAQLLDAMLDCVPKEIPVTVRTPNIFAKWADIEQSTMDTYISEENSDAQRVGLYNDGYMGSDSDLGTFSNREIETTWIGNQAIHTYYGGEFSGNLDWAMNYDTYLPQNAIPEMYKTHLSYINSNIYTLYQNYNFSAEYDVPNVDNSAYYGQTVFKFIRDHIGYRLVVRKSEISEQVYQGDTLNIDLDIENTGFANLLKQPKAELILEKDGEYIKTQIDINPMEWYSCTINNVPISVKLPGEIETGNWNIYLRMSIGNKGISDSYLRCIKFANNDTWNTSLGANYVGSFEVVQSNDIDKITDNTFYQNNIDAPIFVSSGEKFTYNNMIILDGNLSSDNEWNSSSMYAQDGDNELYISNDDKNLYIMAKVVQKAVSPVYNLRITNETNGESYWLYYQSNGFVYFNHGDYNGCICKYVGDYVEFKIPFGDIMGLNSNVVLSSIVVFIQDSSQDGWPSVGKLTSEEYVIKSNFDVYSTCRKVNLLENDNFTLNVETSNSSETYQWYFNDIAIDNATDKTYTIQNASANSVGMYSVKVISELGIEKTIDICEVLQVYSINNDDNSNNEPKFNITDLLMLKKHLLNVTILDETYIEKLDTNNDLILNIIDLIGIKSEVL